MNRNSALALVLGLFGAALFAADWPQWQGPTRDNISRDTGLLQEWPKEGPKLLWTFKELGHGYSGPAVVGDRLYILGTRGDSEYLFALDVGKGTKLWEVKLGPTYTFKGNQWGVGPRSTASVADNLVYALGGSGDLVCVTTAGQEKWRKSMPKDLGGLVNPIGGGPKPPEGFAWGWCWSPLVDGDKFICYPGGPNGALAALDRQTGNVLWRSKDVKVQCSYSSPIVGEVAGVRQYIFASNEGLHGVDAKDGKRLWFWQKKPTYNDYLVPAPILHGDAVYISVGPKPGCDLIKLTAQNGKFTVKKVYFNRIMKNALGGVVLLKGHVYGYSASRGWTCQNFKTGKEVWSDKTLDSGSLVYADNRLYCYTEEDGIVALAEASPKGWSEKGRFTIPQQGKKAVSGKHWTRPVVANGRLYLRDQELLFCYDIKKK